jgi:pilus assembly protein CpaE
MAAVIISGDEWLSQRVRRGLAQEGFESAPNNTVAPELASAFFAHARPAELVVVVLPPDIERMASLVTDLRPRVQAPILAVGPASDVRLVLRTLRNGASEYLDVEDLEAELEGGVRRHRSSDAGQRAGQIYAVYGPCGGTGASSLAVNLAAALARSAGRSLLVDLQLTTGDLASLLDLKPAFTLAELGQHAGQMDRTLFHKSLAAHPSGVHLLAPPHSPADREYVQPDAVHQCLTLGRNLFPHVVVDVDRSCREIGEAALRLADRILVPLRLDFPCLRNSRRALDYLSELGIARDRAWVVVNRQGMAQELPLEKAEQALGFKLTHVLPDDTRVMLKAANNGEPAVIGAPSARISRALGRLAEAMAAAPAA